MIYVLTVADTTRVASFLRTQGIDAHAYSGETESERRLELEDALIGNDVKALVATSALGMGFDTPDLGFVTHPAQICDRDLDPSRLEPRGLGNRPADEVQDEWKLGGCRARVANRPASPSHPIHHMPLPCRSSPRPAEPTDPT